MLRNTLNSLTNVFDTVMRIPSNCSVPVRYRYFKDKPVKMVRSGYKDYMAWKGPLPRLDTSQRVPRPLYIPSQSWTEKKALYGQNDYIDILGDQNIHPTMISYNIPYWLRGFRGNEFQMLLRKRAFIGQKLRATSLYAYYQMKKRINYQFKFLNRKKPQNRMPLNYKHYIKDQ